MKNLVIDRIEKVENCLDEIEKIIDKDITDEEYRTDKNIQNIHTEVIKALNLLRRA
ncbi:hypothetical protein [Metabacillus fastidiosus]|uniref:hypothetical protein n=1 Tax=Metabacillus fastidiosus TaxID=1458 RepID=UPI003D29440D